MHLQVQVQQVLVRPGQQALQEQQGQPVQRVQQVRLEL
jgi:hypothetical protein